MSLGKAPSQQDMFRTSADICDEELADTSLYKLLHRECHRLFPDEAFADLFQDVGRRSIPPRIVAVVMVLQRFEGLSDRDAVDHFKFDLRWKLRWLLAPTTMHDIEARSRAAPSSQARDAHPRARGPA
jgi:hypothetical protein